jgi:cell division protein FtsB
MSEFKKRRSRRAEILRVGLGFLGLLALAGIAFGATRAAWGMYGKFAEAAAARAGAEAQLEELQARHANIEAEVDALSSPRGLEAEVRERYGVVKPGEGEIAIVRQASSSEVLRRQPGLLESLWQLLFVW